MKTRPVGAAQRDAVRAKVERMGATQACLVWILGRDGKVTSATVPASFLGIDEISMGTYSGLAWWPVAYI